MTGYSTNQVAELVGLTADQVRAFVKTGLLSAAEEHRPRHRYRYSFQDIVLLRMARRLKSAGVRNRGIARALRNLKARLPAGKSLSSVRVRVVGDDVLVQEEDAVWDPESGQMAMDFPMSPLTREVAPLVKAAVPSMTAQPDGRARADDWYDLGIDLEMVGDHAQAREMYRRAIDLDPLHVDARVNLGRLKHLSGENDAATALFQQAIEIDPRHATAWFNLGVVREKERAVKDAIAAYEKAVSLDRMFPDAHFNLARLYERTGDKQAAVRHLSSYRTLCKSRSS